MSLNAAAIVLELASLLAALPAPLVDAGSRAEAVGASADAAGAPTLDPTADPEGNDYAWAQHVLAHGPRTLGTLRTALADNTPFTATLAADGKTAILVRGGLELHFVPGSRAFSARIVPAIGGAATPLRTAIDVDVARNGAARITGGLVWHDGSAAKALFPLPRYRERRAGDRELFTLSVDANGKLQRAHGYVPVGGDDILAYDALMTSYVKSVAGTDVCMPEQAPIDVKLAPNRPVEPFDVCSQLYEAKLLRNDPVALVVPALLP